MFALGTLNMYTTVYSIGWKELARKKQNYIEKEKKHENNLKIEDDLFIDVALLMLPRFYWHSKHNYLTDNWQLILKSSWLCTNNNFQIQNTTSVWKCIFKKLFKDVCCERLNQIDI